jgi:plasmid stabilization system protein ParE
VAQVVYSENALANREGIVTFLAGNDPEAALAAVAAIESAVDALSRHPLIGRPATRELRELVISFGRTGYVALYRFLPARDEVRALAIRHQRELGYAP